MGYFSDGSRVAASLVIFLTVVVAPNFEDGVFSSRYKMLTRASDCESIQFSFLGSVNLANNLTIELLPISDLAVTASGQKLILVRMEDNLFEQRRFEQADDSAVAIQIPDNAATVAARADCLIVVLADLNRPDSSTVFLERGLHRLGLLADLPNTHLAFAASRKNLLAVSSCSDSRYSVMVGIVDDIEDLTRLGKE